MLGKIDFLNIDYPKRWSKKGEVENLSFKKAKKFIKYLRNKHKGYVAFDTETESLAKKYNRLVSIQFAIDDETGFVICLDKPFTDYSKSEANEIRKDLKELFEDEDTNIIWVGHNAQFDVCQVCNQLNVKYIARPIIDNILFIHLLDENRIKQATYYDRHGKVQKMSQALKAVCREFFEFTLYDKEAIEARGSNNLLLLPKDKFIEYAGMDGYITFRTILYLELVAKKYDYLEKAMNLLINLLSNALKMLAWVSSNGFYVDMNHLKYLLSEDSPINSRLEEIKEAYMQDETCKAVNAELYKSNSQGITSTFGMTTPWILNLNKESHRVQLFYLSKKGFKLEPVQEPKAKSKYGTGKTFQNTYAKENKIVALYQEEQGLKKLKSSYLNPIWETMTTSKDSKDGRIRADFVLNGTVTGRVCSRCIRKGTKIEVLRDLKKNPEGINIEDVKSGDYVYCYDKNCKPTIRKVKAVVCNGKKELVRITWRIRNSKIHGYLDCTPDHRIRLVTGDYVRADELQKGDSVLSMHRIKDCLSFTNSKNMREQEHRFIYRKLIGKIPDNFDIHHIDGNHYNNVVSNLECISHSEHSTYHDNEKWSREGYRDNMSNKLCEYSMKKSTRKRRSIQATIQSSNPKVRKARSISAKEQWKNDTFRESMTGVNSPVYRPLEENFLEILFECKGSVSEYSRLYNWDFATLNNKIKKEGINYNAIKLRFGGDGKRLTKKRIEKHISKCDSITELSISLHITRKRLIQLLAYYNISYKGYVPTNKERIRAKLKLNIHSKDNHIIVSVEKLKVKDYVYDIEVEGCHNFIANEIDVHNCPNLQQIPRSDTLLKKQIKCLYCAEPPKEGEEKKILVQADFCANEIRFWAAISSDPYLCNAFNESFEKGKQFRSNPTDKKLEEEAHLQGDIHKQTASMMYKVPIKEVTKNLRQSAKGLSLGIMYQRGVPSVAKQLGISEEEAQKLFDKFFEHFTTGVEWANKQKKLVKKYGYVESPLGRRRRLGTLIINGNKLIDKSKEEDRKKGRVTWIQGNKLIGRAERQAVNSPIQGLASDLALISLFLLYLYIIKNDLKTRIVNSVHDSVVMEIPESEVYEMAQVVRKIFTEKSRKYAYKYFNWKMPTHIDVDFEIGQNRNYICKKCGAYVPRYKDKCDCGCTDLIKHRLNMGYGTMLGWNETKQELKLLRKGF